MPVVVQRILQRLVSQRVPLLQKVHAQNARHADGRAANLAALRVVRLDQRFQPRPRHHHIHLSEEPLPACLALLAGVLGTGKARLFHAKIFSARATRRHCGMPG
jgi:hypothetical protein